MLLLLLLLLPVFELDAGGFGERIEVTCASEAKSEAVVGVVWWVDC